MYLGNLEQGLGDVNDTTEVLNVVDALLHGGGVVGAGSVQDAGDLLDLLLGVAGPGRAGVMSDSPEDGQQTESDNGFLVDDVELVANGSHAETGTRGQDSGLGEGAVSGDGDRVQKRLGLLLGVFLGHIGVVAGRGDLCRDGRESAKRKGWAETGGACGWGISTGPMASELHLRASTYRPRSLRDERPWLRMKSGEIGGAVWCWRALSGVLSCRTNCVSVHRPLPNLCRPAATFFPISSVTAPRLSIAPTSTNKTFDTLIFKMAGTKSPSVAGVKRKRIVDKSDRRESKSKSKARRQQPSSGSENDDSDDPQTEILRLESEILESRKHYNNIAKLLQLAKDDASEDEIAILAAVALFRIFTRLLAGGDMVKSKGMAQPEVLVANWLGERYREYKDSLLNHFLSSKNARKQSTALTLLMRSVKEESKQKDYSWQSTALTRTVEVLLLDPEEALRDEFVEKYFSVFDDIRYFTFRIIK